jgi:hypothetical protein
LFTDVCTGYCDNEGTCVKDTRGQPSCRCIGSFTGKHCQEKSEFAYIAGGIAGAVIFVIIIVLLIWMICVRLVSILLPISLPLHTKVYPKVSGLSHNEINNNNKHSLRSNMKGYGGRAH